MVVATGLFLARMVFFLYHLCLLLQCLLSASKMDRCFGELVRLGTNVLCVGGIDFFEPYFVGVGCVPVKWVGGMCCLLIGGNLLLLSL
jgi:hypothetical protein